MYHDMNGWAWFGMTFGALFRALLRHRRPRRGSTGTSAQLRQTSSSHRPRAAPKRIMPEEPPPPLVG